MHQAWLLRYASARLVNDSLAKRLPRTNGTICSTRGLPTDPGWVGHETAFLHVLGEDLAETGIGPVRPVHDRGHVLRNEDLDHPAEERPRRPKADDDRRLVLAEGQVDIRLPTLADGEDQGVHSSQRAGEHRRSADRSGSGQGRPAGRPGRVAPPVASVPGPGPT